MSFRAEFNDVTKFKGDAIVNSLGYLTPNVLGSICFNIIKKTKSLELYNILVNDALENKRTCNDYFITDSYGLKANKIINVYPPYKNYNEDYDLNLLTELFRKVILVAKENKFKSIGIPYIGCGGNEYSDIDPYVAMNRIASEYFSDDSIDIVFIMFHGDDEENIFDGYKENQVYEEIDRNKRSTIYGTMKLSMPKELRDDKIECNGSIIDDECLGAGSILTVKDKKVIDRNEYMRCYNAFNYFIDDETIIRNLPHYEVPFDYFHRKLTKDKDGIKSLDAISLGLYDESRISRMHTGKAKCEMIDIIRLSILEGLSAKDICIWMIVSGYNFNPNDEIHMAFLNELYLNNGFKGQYDTEYDKVSVLYVFSKNIKSLKKRNELFRDDRIKIKHKKYDGNN